MMVPDVLEAASSPTFLATQKVLPSQIPRRPKEYAPEPTKQELMPPFARPRRTVEHVPQLPYQMETATAPGLVELPVESSAASLDAEGRDVAIPTQTNAQHHLKKRIVERQRIAVRRETTNSSYSASTRIVVFV